MADAPVTFASFQASVKEVVEQELNGLLFGKSFEAGEVAQWTADISEGILKVLASQSDGRPFKFVANCTILQRTGAGLHTSSSCLWNSKTDGSCTVRWEGDDMYAIVTVYGLAIS